MKTIKINGNSSCVLSIDLKDVLSCIDHGKKTIWGLMWLHVTANLNDGQSIVDLENEVNKSDNGMSIAWDELLTLSEQITQSIDLLIIGDKEISNIIRYADDEQMHNKCDYTIELIDSSYWIIYTNNDVFVQNLFNRLDGVEYYDASR